MPASECVADNSTIAASGYSSSLWRSKFFRFCDSTIVSAARAGICVCKRALRRRVITEICVRVDVGLGEISFSRLESEIYECIELILCERLYDIPPYDILGGGKVRLVKRLAFIQAYGPTLIVRKLRLACNAMPIANGVVSFARIVHPRDEVLVPAIFHNLLPCWVRSHLRKRPRSIGRLRDLSGAIRRCATRRER